LVRSGRLEVKNPLTLPWVQKYELIPRIGIRSRIVTYSVMRRLYSGLARPGCIPAGTVAEALLKDQTFKESNQLRVETSILRAGLHKGNNDASLVKEVLCFGF